MEHKSKTLKEYMEQNSNKIPELQSPFEQLREVDADARAQRGLTLLCPSVRENLKRKEKYERPVFEL